MDPNDAAPPPALSPPAAQTYCAICDRDLDPSCLCGGTCGLCWEEHARDLEAAGDLDGALWATLNARRAFKLPIHAAAD